MVRTRRVKIKSKNRSYKVSEVEILIKSAKAASQKAIVESQELGLSISYIKGYKLIEKASDGTKKIIKEIPKTKVIKPYLKKGSKLCLK